MAKERYTLPNNDFENSFQTIAKSFNWEETHQMSTIN